MSRFVNEPVTEDTLENKYLSFVLGKECYALEIRDVTEIIGIQVITPVPEMPNYVKGIINLRGKVIPVIDARLRFLLESREYDARTCIVVIDSDDTTVGLVVDMVQEVLEIKPENIDPADHIQSDNDKRFVKGLGRINKETKIILDAKKIMFEGAETLAAAYQESLK